MITIREMTIADYGEMYALWQVTSKKALSESDSEDAIKQYLDSNKGFSQVAVSGGKVVGTVLAGHDGRRGSFYHLAVLPEFRRQGIAKQMVDAALAKLKQQGITKTHIFCFIENENGHKFWETYGFIKREDIDVFSYTIEN